MRTFATKFDLPAPALQAFLQKDQFGFLLKSTEKKSRNSVLEHDNILRNCQSEFNLHIENGTNN